MESSDVRDRVQAKVRDSIAASGPAEFAAARLQAFVCRNCAAPAADAANAEQPPTK